MVNNELIINLIAMKQHEFFPLQEKFEWSIYYSKGKMLYGY